MPSLKPTLSNLELTILQFKRVLQLSGLPVHNVTGANVTRASPLRLVTMIFHPAFSVTNPPHRGPNKKPAENDMLKRAYACANCPFPCSVEIYEISLIEGALVRLSATSTQINGGED